MSRIAFSLLAAACLFGQASEYEQGVALFERGNIAAAVPHFVRAAAAEPRNAQVWKALGAAYAAQKQYAEAENAFRRSCELDPKLEDTCYYWGRALFGMGKFDAALKALERADGRSWKVRLTRAQAAEGAGDAALAEREFRAAIAGSPPNDARAGAAYGHFLLRQGRGAEAIPTLDAAAARDPRSAEAQTNLGRALLESGRTAEAVEHLGRAVALAPDSAEAQLLLGKALVRAGRAEEAQAHFEAAARNAK